MKTLVEYSANSIASKTLIDTKAGTITLFSFDGGQGLSGHMAPYDAVVQIVDAKQRSRSEATLSTRVRGTWS